MKPLEKTDLRGLLHNAGEAFISLNKELKCIYVNDKAIDLLEKNKEEIVGNTMWQFFPSIKKTINNHDFESAMKNQTSKTFEFKHPKQNKWLIIKVIPHVNGIDIFYHDITKEKLINKAKEHAEECFAKAFESSPIPLTISRISDDTIIDVNKSFLDLFEFNRKEVIGNNPLVLNMFSNNEDITYLKEKDALNKHEITLFSKTKKPINIIFSTEIILINDEHHLLSTFIDLTEKLKSQKIIADSEAWFRSIADNSPIMIWSADNKKLCNYVNSTWIEFTGKSTSQILGNDWKDIIHPDDLENFEKTYNKAFELKKPFHREYRLKRFDGRFRWIFDFAKPILMPDGNFKGFIGSCADVHNRHALYVKLEKLVRERTLELTQSLEKEKELNDAKTRFVSMASHEFRTPLSSILSSIYLIEKYTEMIGINEQSDINEKRQKHISRIKNSINHLTEILNDFLSLDKLSQGCIELKKEAFNLKMFSEEIIEEIKSILRENQTIRFNYCGDYIIFQDKRILKNIYLNLLSNAIKYSGEGKTIQLNTEVTKKKVTIRFEDDGIGIPKEEQNNIFTKFYRAKNVVNIEGTGLGLNIVKRYLDLMNGEINFKSSPNRGTTFMIQFPRNINE